MIAGLVALASAMGAVWLLHHGYDYWAAGLIVLVLDTLCGASVTVRLIRRGK